MQNYLPSKQFVKTILITAFVGTLIFFGGKLLNKKTTWNNTSSDELALASESTDFFSQDTDDDGLYDWEEALWSTDPALKDTDGDGVDDKTFIENKRKESDFDETYNPDPSNETEVFAKQFFTTAAVLNQGGAFNQETISQFSTGVDQSIINFNLKDTYTLSDIKLSPVSADSYYSSFKTLYSSLPHKDIPELETLALVIQNPDDTSSLEKISNINLMYTKFVDGLVRMDVPYGASGGHLFLLNNIDKLTKVLVESQNINNDPLKVTTYLSKYSEYSSNIESALGTLASYFSQNGILQ